MSVGAVNKQTGDRIPTAGMPAIDDALDLTSVNPVQNAIITAALANKQDKTDNNLDTTAKTIVGAINEHEGDIDSLMSGLTNLNIHRNFSSDTIANTITELIAYVRDNLASGASYKLDGVLTVNNVDIAYLAVMGKLSTKVYGIINYGDKIYSVNYVAGTYKNIFEYTGTNIA